MLSQPRERARDDIFGGKGKGRGRGGLPHGNGADFPPRLQQPLRPGGVINRRVRPGPEGGIRVGGIHDGVRRHLGNVIPDDLKGHSDASDS